MSWAQLLKGWIILFTGKFAIQGMIADKTYYVMYCMVVYPLDTIMHPQNNWELDLTYCLKNFYLGLF